MSSPGLESVELRERCAVVTGASRGLGAGLAEAFSAAGLRVALCSRGLPALDESDRVLCERVDVRDESALERFAARTEERFGTIDLWVNNAGVLAPIAPLRDVEAASFREHVEINLTGVFLGTRTYVRHLHARAASGVLINISSGAASKPYRGWGAYCAAKSAVERLTEVVAAEEAERGLRAHSVAPGVIDSEMQGLVRGSSPEHFPDVERFKQIERDGAFNSPAFVARHLLELAFDPARAGDEVVLRIPDEPRPG